MSNPSNDVRGRAAALIQQGAAALKAGDTARAYAALREAVRLDPNNEQGWLWLAGTVSSPDQRRFCLERALQINPQSTIAKRGLSALQGQGGNTNPPPQASTLSTPLPRPAASYDPLAKPAPANQPTASKPTSQQPFDPLAQPAPAATKPAPTPPVAKPIEALPPTPEPPANAEGKEAARRALLSQEQPANTRAQTRPSFVKPGKGEKPVSDPKIGQKSANSGETSLRPNIPVDARPRRMSRDSILVIGLVLALLVVIGGVAVLVFDNLSRQSAAPVDGTAPTAAATGEAATVETAPTSVPAATPAVAATTDPAIATQLSAADTLAQQGDYAAAVEGYTAVLNQGSNPAAAFGRGAAYFALGDFEQARDDFDQAITGDPNNAEAYHQRGRAKTRLGDAQGAITDFDQAIALEPEHALPYLRRGLAYESLLELDQALADLNQALELDPNLGIAYSNRARILGRLARYDESLADINKAIELDPESSILYGERGLLLVEQGKFDDAEQDCQRMELQYPGDLTPTYCFGRVALGREQYEQAISLFDQALALNYDYAPAYHWRGVAKAATGDATGARADFQEAITIYREIGETTKATSVEELLAALP
jgi:tetratricopeptide (TPR) repeat protein